MAVIDVKVHRRHRVSVSQHRASGSGAGPGGWAWSATCRCGYRSWNRPDRDGAEELATMHLNEDVTMVDVLEDRGSEVVSIWRFPFMHGGVREKSRNSCYPDTLLRVEV